MAAIASLSVVALLMVVAGVWAVITLSTAGGEYEQAPGCEMAETAALKRLVAERETGLDERIEGLGNDRDGRQCRWSTAEDATSVPSAARLVMVSHKGNGGNNGEEDASAALRDASKDNSPKRVAKLGDEAFSWYESESDFTWGCVGARVSNMYTQTCYTASVDFQASESVPKGEMASDAEKLARDIVKRIQQGDY